MTDLETEVGDWMEQSIVQALDDGGRDRVNQMLYNWLAFTARKKPLPDLPQRLEDFRKRIRVLADNLVLVMGQNGCVVKATGDAETTLKALERGTDWFDPVAGLTEMVAGAIFEQRS